MGYESKNERSLFPQVSHHKPSWWYSMAGRPKQSCSEITRPKVDPRNLKQRLAEGKIFTCERHFRPEDFEYIKTGRKNWSCISSRRSICRQNRIKLYLRLNEILHVSVNPYLRLKNRLVTMIPTTSSRESENWKSAHGLFDYEKRNVFI